MKCINLFIISMICTASACAPRHYYSSGFIKKPSLDQFGAQLKDTYSQRIVTAYIRSKMPLRTEYIYERLVIRLPKNLKIVTSYKLPHKDISILYQKGGQAGQVTSTTVEGFVKVTEQSKRRLILHAQLKFTSFSVEGSLPKPSKIVRSGVLKPVKGYQLYR